MLETVLCGEFPVVEAFAEEGSVWVGGTFHVAFLLDIGLGEDAFFGLVGHHSVDVLVGGSERKRVDDGRLTLQVDKGR